VTRDFAAFVARRLGAAALFVAIVPAAALLLARLAPGDAATDLLLSGADAGTVAAARARAGLDRPAVVQLGEWARGLATFDLGESSMYGRPVAPLVADRLLNTAWLAATALCLATMVGLPLGVLTGARPRSVASACVAVLSTALIACPPIVGVLLLLFAAVSTGWLSTTSGALAVPALALALPLAATLERLQSQATADALASPDLTAAAARGVPPARLLWVHAGRQSLRPVLGVYGLMIGTLLSGSLAVETIAGWPGIGRLTFDALVGRDLFLIAGCALAGAALIAAANAVVDIVRAAIDPRVSEGV
jgi:peptide/nickel transport system permease protein